ncbi:MAG: hypothetical protein A2X19_06740 [Bacteroidetes bacterium GWE2_39_28]|nr:MAG: hypothetical protein A2X19_06740 [Bacteroidetes bacterium GWE2_39_28]OFY13355.1 MAG: hypothetical protein A2X16_00255 [Bacteroidetes bacterium GWF2_39_10]OFZ09729.1 MAG: hypothetical protein A2465_09820 [Bacteroidetes bacterium RIFOXYC2_FULL_39_11]HCT94547.1 hypothetical protein [Rikenellaceae bacterium]
MAIIITGASKGIGKYLFEEYSKKGYEVYGTYNSTKNIIENKNITQVDISDYKSVTEWIVKLNDSLKDLILINCAGITYNAFTHKSDIEQWHKVIDINLKGTFNVIRQILPIMRNQNYGRIITFTSVVVKYPTLGISAYTASKSGLIGLTKTIAIENASKGITANTINLGYSNIGMGLNNVPKENQEQLKLKIPNGRFCNPEEILNTIDYIINTEYFNGSTIDINGGLI